MPASVARHGWTTLRLLTSGIIERAVQAHVLLPCPGLWPERPLERMFGAANLDFRQWDDDRDMTKQEALALRFFLGLLALAALVVQLVVIPRVAAGYADVYPELSYLEPLYVTALAVACVGFVLALLAVWHLVSAAVTDRAPTRRSTRWANVMTISLTFMALILAGVFVHAGFVANVGGPAMLFGLLVSLALVPVAFALRRWVTGWLANDAHYALSAG